MILLAQIPVAQKANFALRDKSAHCALAKNIYTNNFLSNWFNWRHNITGYFYESSENTSDRHTFPNQKMYSHFTKNRTP